MWSSLSVYIFIYIYIHIYTGSFWIWFWNWGKKKSKLWQLQAFLTDSLLAPWISSNCHREENPSICQKNHGVYPYKQKFFSRASVGFLTASVTCEINESPTFRLIFGQKEPWELLQLLHQVRGPPNTWAAWQRQDLNVVSSHRGSHLTGSKPAEVKRHKKAMRKQKRGAVQCGAVFSNCGKM